METSNLRLGEILIDAGVIKQAQLELALDLQKKRQMRLGMILLQERIVTEPQLIQALSRRLSIPWVSLWHLDIEDALLDLVPAAVAEEFFLIPIYIRTTGLGQRALYVAMNDPMDDSALRFVAAKAGMVVKPMIAAPSDIAAAIRVYYYDEEDLSGDPPPPIPRSSSSGSTIALPPPVTSAHSKITPPPAPDATSRTTPPPPPPPQKEEKLEEIEEIEPTEEFDVDAVEALEETPDEVDEEATEPVETDAEETSEEPSEETSEETSEADEPAEVVEPISDRDIEKHLFGVGKSPGNKGISMTLLDGTTINFGDAKRKAASDASAGEPTSTAQSYEITDGADLVTALRASVTSDAAKSALPSEQWEDYIAALLEVLFKKHLLLFDEYMDALKKK